jgi:hypothetical protein
MQVSSSLEANTAAGGFERPVMFALGSRLP